MTPSAKTSITATASVFYGLHVRVADVVTAAKAYRLVKHAVRALNRITIRRSRGTLGTRSRERNAVTLVSCEVWDLVRFFAICIALADGRRDALEWIHCEK